jgi:hypothetical protein
VKLISNNTDPTSLNIDLHALRRFPKGGEFMLKLDQYSESILFQCDRCQHVGELITDIVENEGTYCCWGCLGEMNRKKEEGVKTRNEATQRNNAGRVAPF